MYPNIYTLQLQYTLQNSNSACEKECMKIYVDSKKLEKEANETCFSIIIYSLKGFFLSSTLFQYGIFFNPIPRCAFLTIVCLSSLLLFLFQ